MKTMVNIAGTSNIDWCLRALCPDLADRAASLDALAALAEPGGVGGVVYAPYLSSAGNHRAADRSWRAGGFFRMRFKPS